MIDYVEVNAALWDEWAKDNCSFSKPITHEEFVKAMNGEWDIYATPTKPVPKSWFGNLKGKKVLCLASGGGQQSPIFAALGADVTVLDISRAQLDLDKYVSDREGYSVTLKRGDMSKRLPFEDKYFDLIFNPVSTTYIQEVEPLWRECHRILREGGKLITGITNPVVFAFDLFGDKLQLRYKLPYDPLENHYECENKSGDIQFSHSITTQICGQIKAGFTLKDLFEDYHYTSISAGTKEQMKPAQIAMKLASFMPIYLVTLAIA